MAAKGNIAGPIIAAGANIASGIFGFIGAKKQQERQFAANKSQQDVAYQRNLAQYHRENAYNDPSAQMARLKAAGLNPNLVYGSGTQTQAAHAAPAQAAKANYSQPKIGTAEAIQTFQNVQLQQAQIASIQENTEAVRLDNLKRAIQTENIITYQENADGTTSMTVTKQNRYRLKLQTEQQQKEKNISSSQLRIKEQQITLALRKYNINVSDPLIIRQMALNLQFGNASEITKRMLLTATGATLEAAKAIGKIQ